MDKKLRGTTLIESLVAMVIVLLSFVAALAIYVNVTESSNLHQKLKAHYLLNNIAFATEREKTLLDAEIEGGDGTLKIYRKVKSYMNSKSVYLVTFEAQDKAGVVLATRKELLIDDGL